MSLRPAPAALALGLPHDPHHALPSLFAALKIAAPATFLGAILAEYLGSGGDSTLGRALIAAQTQSDAPQLWYLALVSGLISGLGYLVVGAVAQGLLQAVQFRQRVLQPRRGQRRRQLVGHGDQQQAALPPQTEQLTDHRQSDQGEQLRAGGSTVQDRAARDVEPEQTHRSARIRRR